MQRSPSVARPMFQGVAVLALAFVVVAAGADGGAAGNPTLDALQQRAERYGQVALAWYQRTPPVDRVTWGGLGGCAVLGL